jgi:hypothetical protein
MSRTANTSIVLVIIAIAINVVITQRMGLLDGGSLFYLAITTSVFIGVGFFWGAANAGIAALWASARKKQASTLAAFNFGFTIFLVVQVLGHILYEQNLADRPTKVSAVDVSKTIEPTK